MVKWSGSKKKQPTDAECTRRLLLTYAQLGASMRLTKRDRETLKREEAAQQKKRDIKLAIKAKLDLYGPDSLNREEAAIVRLFPDFFYPERG